MNGILKIIYGQFPADFLVCQEARRSVFLLVIEGILEQGILVVHLQILGIYPHISSINCQGSQITASLANGLAARYPFCGNANDESGNGNDGIVHGASLTSDRSGNTNSAYQFNGVSDSIMVADSPELNIRTGQSFSIALWLKVGYVE